MRRERPIIAGMERPPSPRLIEPMLAKPADLPPSGPGWAFELKWDGVRAIASLDRGELRIVSRSGADATRRYPELAELAGALAGRSAVFDGEIVALDDEGRPSFQALQPRMGLTKPEVIRRRMAEVPVTYVIFDLLWLDGESLLEVPYERRRELLSGLELEGDAYRVPGHHVGSGADFLAAVQAQGLEGIVCKRLGSRYVPGRRSDDWLKVRARLRQELVIGGWMPGEGVRRSSVGSLLVGYWDATPRDAERLGQPQRLVYAGGVGTGFTDAILARLRQRLEPLARPDPPFELGEDPRLKYKARARERGGLRWVEPVLVCEVEFTEWTREGTLRQPAFKGLRDDKDPREVVREHA